MTALEQLYQNLQEGKSYGKYYADYEFPVFHDVMWVDYHKQYIHTSHFGSSAGKNTIERLAWELEVIFKMTAEEFMEHYHTWDEYKEIDKAVDDSRETSHLTAYPKHPRWNFFCKGKDGKLHFMKVEADDRDAAYRLAAGRLEKESGCEPEMYGLFKVSNPLIIDYD